jgi:alkaline phosphatase D
MTLLVPSRRMILGGLAAAPFVWTSRLSAQLAFADFPFTLGVAAGDGSADGFVLWTRLAPRPQEPHGGMPLAPVPVDWEVATDEGFKTVVAKGTEKAWPETAHSVHAEVTGLQPARPYWYRFHAAGATSPIGRALTLPAAGAHLDKVTFAAVGCQHFEAGWYTNYRHVSEETLDFVYHYGDFIYEYHPGFVLDAFERPIDPVRLYWGREPYSLDDYRLRYAQELTDTDLQAARSAHPWFCTYDDHEVQNNWAGQYDEHGTPPEQFLLRRRQALQVWYEHMPVRRSAFPQADGNVEFRRRVDYGNLARMHFPNTRLYRSDQPCNDGFVPACPGMTAPGAQMIDAAQERWLGEGFASSHQRWQGLLQQVMMAPIDRRSPKHDGPVPTLNMDSWAGYPAQRERLFAMMGRHPQGNVVVVTGDEHQNYALDLTSAGRTVASEFVSTSITSGGDGYDTRPGNDRLLADNANLHWTNDRRGYVVSEVTPEAWIGHYKVVDAVTTRGLSIRTAASWAAETGKPGLVKA